MEEKLSTKNSMNFFVEHAKVLAIIFFVSAVVVAVVTLFMPNYYKSQVLLMPSAVNSVSKSVLNEGDKLDPYLFGSERDSEYILEMLGSWEIIGKTAQKFKLKEHYGIKAEGDLGNDLVNLKLKKNIKVKRSDYLAVRLIVWDKDPQYAADIANYMAQELTSLRHKMKQAKADSIKTSLQKGKQRIMGEYLQYTDSLAALLKKSNIYSPSTTSDRIMQEMAKQIASGNKAAVDRLESRMSHLTTYAAEIERLRAICESKSDLLEKWDDFYSRSVLDLESDIPTDNIVENAIPAGQKDKPKRLLIVLIAAVLCTLIGAEVIIIRERRKSSKQEDVQSV